MQQCIVEIWIIEYSDRAEIRFDKELSIRIVF